MQNTIERMLAESLSLGRAGQFVHRYETCQMRLAAGIEGFQHVGAELLPSPDASGSESHVADITHGDTHDAPLFPGIARTHYLTVFLQAYVAARQFFPDETAQAVTVDQHSVS